MQLKSRMQNKKPQLTAEELQKRTRCERQQMKLNKTAEWYHGWTIWLIIHSTCIIIYVYLISIFRRV